MYSPQWSLDPTSPRCFLFLFFYFNFFLVFNSGILDAVIDFAYRH